jgi:hypothetical protein
MKSVSKTVGTRSIGGGRGSGSSNIKVYTVVGGNEIFPGLMGVKRMAEAIPAINPPLSGDPIPTMMLPDGVGIIMNIQSGDLFYMINDNRSLVRRDLIEGERVFSATSISVSGSEQKLYVVTGI